MDYYTTGFMPSPFPVQMLPEEEFKSSKEPDHEKFTNKVLVSKRSSNKLVGQRIDSEPQTPTALGRNKPLVLNRGQISFDK